MTYPVQLKLEPWAKYAISNTRRGDRETSIAAVRDTHARAPRHRQLALATHAAHPEGLTDFELADLTHLAQTSIGKRRLDLMKAGLVEATDRKRPAPSGTPAIVWKITAKGLAAVDASPSPAETVTETRT